jgi:hypothetical protein
LQVETSIFLCVSRFPTHYIKTVRKRMPWSKINLTWCTSFVIHTFGDKLLMAMRHCHKVWSCCKGIPMRFPPPQLKECFLHCAAILIQSIILTICKK